MTVRTCIFLVLILNIIGLSAQINQHGIPEIVNYPPEVTRGSEQNWAIVQDTIHVRQNEKHVLFGFFENDRYYAGGFSKGLLVLQGDTAMVVAKGGEFYEGKDIFGLTSYDEELISWMGDVSQIDDILVLGIKIKTQ